ncbi:MAG TPA: NlpC/P60 family protein [Ilumatobacteraceae bacterium]|nr:NlpC/P60 family protein [Ilumatobacteraceae bacterium]HRB03152.1 NlpC/P60 family protein [Ilumatobacteraceae bacterium]
MIETRRLTTRVLAAAIAVTTVFAGVPTANADGVSDQKQVVEQLGAELDRLNERIATLDEEYGAAQDKQVELNAEIVISQAKVDSENAKITVLQAAMTQIAVNRFVGGDSLGLSPLFSSATSYNEAQQLDALSSIALDTGAGTADELDSVLRTLNTDVATLQRQEKEAADLIGYLDAKLAEGQKLIEEYTKKSADAKAKYGEMVQAEAERQATLRAEKAAKEAAAAQAKAAAAAANAAAANAAATAAAAAAAAPRGGGNTGVATAGGGTTTATTPNTPVAAPKPPIPQPPPVSGKAGAAVAAAYSQLGVPYVAFRASPSQGFDCSGLTMWAWAQAGVSIPHQSGQQFRSNPQVPKDQAQPGDLVFFYSPISHVGMYVGNGMMIDSPHTGAVVRLRVLNWNAVVGVSRPG